MSLIDDLFNHELTDEEFLARIEDPRRAILEIRRALLSMSNLASESGRRLLVMRFISEALPHVSRKVGFSTILEAVKFLDRKSPQRDDRLINISPLDIDRMAETTALPKPEDER